MSSSARASETQIQAIALLIALSELVAPVIEVRCYLIWQHVDVITYRKVPSGSSFGLMLGKHFQQH